MERAYKQNKKNYVAIPKKKPIKKDVIDLQQLGN